jgi:hypothetical protein
VEKTKHLPEWMEKAIWTSDLDALSERAGCVCCCCADHTFENCPARAWEGCRGQGTPTNTDLEEWASLYGMTRIEFLNPDSWKT